MAKPAFIITLDTEGDNLWESGPAITTQNTRFLPRFQALCEKYSFKPVWLTNYEMATDDAYIEFAQDVIARQTGEVGMHLHAWNSPPLKALTADDDRFQPYLIEYPDDVMKEKINVMTSLLEDKLQTKMVSHRAGRWAFNEKYARLLAEFGYQTDCSVTPRVNWAYTPGAPAPIGNGGTNYLNFPSEAYFMDLNDIRRPGDSALLQVPMSVQFRHSPLMNGLKQFYDKLRGKKRSPSVNWLRPKGGNLAQMQQVVDACLAQGNSHIEFMLHSSEFMPGGSPTFRDEAAIDALYDDLEQLFAYIAQRAEGMTLAEFYQRKLAQRHAS